MDNAEIQKRIKELSPWYQNIILPGNISTNPTNPNYPQLKWDLIEPHLPKDLTGKTVLDIDCNAGFFSIKMKERGANVLGIDMSSYLLEQAKFVSKILGHNIDYKLCDVYDFVFNNKTKFDYVIFVGVMYHLRYPLLVLDKIAEIVKEKLIFQTELRGDTSLSNYINRENLEPLKIEDDYPPSEQKIFEHPDFPKMFFIEKRYAKDFSNWWFCNLSGAYAMLRSAGFRNIKNYGVAFICDAPSNEQSQTNIDLNMINNVFKK